MHLRSVSAKRSSARAVLTEGETEAHGGTLPRTHSLRSELGAEMAIPNSCLHDPAAHMSCRKVPLYLLHVGVIHASVFLVFGPSYLYFFFLSASKKQAESQRKLFQGLLP